MAPDLDDLLAPRIVADRPPRILTLDIERIKGRAEVEFFDLSDYKNRRIHADNVTEWPRTICAAWRWYGNKRVEFGAEWEDGGHDGMLRKCWDAYHQADIVVGHNLARFDTKKLTAEWAILGLPSPSPWKTVDTLKVARSEFALESNTLDSVARRLGVPGKVDHYDPAVARAAVEGNRAAQRRLRAYNVGDIATTEALYDRLRPWIKNHPPIGLWSGEGAACPNCGGPEVDAAGWARTALTNYAQYQCRNCRAWLRQNHPKGRVQMRQAR